MVASNVVELDWYGCYKDRWSDLVPESMSHPAKVAPGLSKRIYEFALEEGLLSPGMTVLDPFGGIGGFAIHAMLKGINYIGVEIEPRFHLLGQGGDCDGKPRPGETREETIPAEPGYDGWYIVAIEAPVNFYIGKGGAYWEVEPQGDGFPTREEAVAYWEENKAADEPVATFARMHRDETPERIVTVTETRPAPCGLKEEHEPHHVRGNIEYWNEKYGRALGNGWGTARLLLGDSRYLAKVLQDNGLLGGAGGVATSPPYVDSIEHKGGIDPSKSDYIGGPNSQMLNSDTRYGTADGQMSSMPNGGFESSLSSPPFMQTSGGSGVSGGTIDEALLARHAAGNKAKHGYGEGEGNIANLPDDGLDLAIKSFDSNAKPCYNGRYYGTTPEDRTPSSDRGNSQDVSEWPIIEPDSREAEYISSDDTEEIEKGDKIKDKLRIDETSFRSRNIEARSVLEGEETAQGCSRKEIGKDQGREPLSMEGRKEPTTLQGQCREGGMCKLRFSSEPIDSSQEPGSLRQLSRESTSPVCFVSHEPTQENVLGGNQERRGTTEEQRASGLESREFSGVIGSPPYAEARIGQEAGQEQCGHNDAYGGQDGQLGGLSDDKDGFSASLTSPPFEGVTSDRPSESIVAGGLRMGASSMGDGYGESEGNIGNEWGEDFWTASRMILDNLYAVLRPGAYAIFVLKAYIKDGKKIDFPDQWRQVCEAAGFEWTHRIKAWVIEYKGSQYDMFSGKLVERTVSRKSFFRRLAESHGSPPIDYEEVLIFRKLDPIMIEALALGAKVEIVEYA